MKARLFETQIGPPTLKFLLTVASMAALPKVTKVAETLPTDKAVKTMDETLNFGKGEKTVSDSTCRSECENKLKCMSCELCRNSHS